MGVKSFTIASALLVILLSVFAFAAIEDFSFSTSYTNFEACACSYFAIPADIINTGDVPSTYYVSIDGSASDFVTAIPTEFDTLNKGDSQRIYYYYNIPCNAIGRYELITKIKTALGSYKNVKIVSDVKKCSYYNPILLKQSNQICKGNNASFTIYLSNPLSINETIKPKIDGLFANRLYLDGGANAFLINANSSTAIKFNINSEGLSKGEYNFDLIFTGIESGLQDDIPLSLYVKDSCKEGTSNNLNNMLKTKKTTTLKTNSEYKRVSNNKYSINTSLLLLFAAILLFILLLLLVLAAIVKRRRGRKHLDEKKLDEWIEVPVPKKPMKQIIVKKENIVSQKKVKIQKKLVEEESPKNQFSTKILAIILLILFLLLIITGVGYLTYKNSNWILSKISSENSNQTLNQSINNSVTKTTQVEFKNLSEVVSATNEKNQSKTGFFKKILIFLKGNNSNQTESDTLTKQPTVLDKLLGKKPKIDISVENQSYIISDVNNSVKNFNQSTNISINLSNASSITNLSGNSITGSNTSINGTIVSIPYGFNPSSVFIKSYTNKCTIFIGIILVLFIVSLFALTIKQPKSGKKYLSVIKYGLPTLMLLILLYSVIYCYVDGSCRTDCNVVVANAANISIISGLNETNNNANLSYQYNVNITNTSSNISSKCSCFDYKVFGISNWLISIILSVLIVALIFLLIYFIGLFGKEKTAEKTVKKSVIKEEKKIKSKEVSGEKHEAVNIWKDLILLLILLLLLIAIGAFVYYHNPFKSISEKQAISNQYSLEDITLCIVTYDNMAINQDKCSTLSVINITNSNLVCNVSINYSSLPDMIKIDQSKNESINTSDLKIEYNWIIKRGENLLRTGFSQNNTVSYTRFKDNDTIVCEVQINVSKLLWSANSSSFIANIVPAQSNDAKIPRGDVLAQLNELNRSNISQTQQNLIEITNLVNYVRSNNLTNTMQNIIIEEGGIISLDLNNYFVDPDNDSLTFNVDSISSENVSIDIWKGNATIKANPGFLGIVNATITASDPSGESVTGQMRIITAPRTNQESNTPLDFVKRYLLYIIIGIIVLAAILLLLLYLDKGSETKESE